MQRTLLVPLDGTTLAEAALPLAALLAQVLGAKIELVSVIPDATASNPSGPRQYLDRTAGTLRGQHPDVATRLVCGDPAECIVREAAAEHVAMVVMTTHARAGLRRAILGSVAEYVVAHCPAPTLLVRGGHQDTPQLKTLLLAIDNSCAAPLETISELARACGARVVLLRAVAFNETYVWQWKRGAILDSPQAVVAARQQLTDLAARMRERGVSAEARVEIGTAAPTFVAVADEVHADLIVMTTHARTGPQRAIQGGVADAVVHSASQPVLLGRLVPPPLPRPVEVLHALQHR